MPIPLFFDPNYPGNPYATDQCVAVNGSIYRQLGPRMTVPIPGDNALAVNMNYRGPMSGPITVTFSALYGDPADENLVCLTLDCTVASTLTFPSCKRSGGNAGAITSLAIPIGTYEFIWRYSTNEWLLTDNVATELNQAQVENAASTVFGIVSGQRLAQAVAAHETNGAATPPLLAKVATTLPVVTQSGLGTIDGVPIQDGDRILDWNNTDATKRGIWVASSGAWTRAADANTAEELSLANILVTAGSRHYGKTFRIKNVLPNLSTAVEISLPNEGYGALANMARQQKGVYVHIGDSNTVGRPGTHAAVQKHRVHPWHGPWKNWSWYLMANSGTQLNAVVGLISTGDREEAPENYIPVEAPGWQGNPWQAINALKLHTNAICEISLGINDFGLGTAARAPGGPGDPVVFRKNLETLINLILSETTASILLRIPQPFSGADDFGGVAQWAVDAPAGEPTMAGGAAAASAKMIGIHREWIGRNPRVEVFDAPKLVYGADRCDDPTVNCLDHVIGATFLGASIPAASRKLIDDSLHSSALGERREEEAIMSYLGLAPTFAPGNGFIAGTRLPHADIVEGEWFYFEDLGNNGANTIMTVRASPEHLAWRQSQSQMLYGDQRLAGESLKAGEERLFNHRQGGLKRLLGWRNEIKLWFPTTNTTYTATNATLSQIVAGVDPFAEPYYSVTFANVNCGSELAASLGPDVGYPGLVRLDRSRLLVFAYITSRDNLEDKIVSSFTVYPTTGLSDVSLRLQNSEKATARSFSCVRGAPSGSPTITLFLWNIGDGRFVDGPLSFNGYGMPIGTFTFSPGVYQGAWTPNTTNIDAAIAAGVGWIGTAGSNIVTILTNYKFRAVSDITLPESATVSVSN